MKNCVYLFVEKKKIDAVYWCKRQNKENNLIGILYSQRNDNKTRCNFKIRFFFLKKIRNEENYLCKREKEIEMGSFCSSLFLANKYTLNIEFVL